MEYIPDWTEREEENAILKPKVFGRPYRKKHVLSSDELNDEKKIREGGKMKTRITKAIKNNMGLKIINGQLTDKYGRTFETFIDDEGYEDIKPNGVQRDMYKYYQKG